ncbi:conserved exported hypothetical protein [Flavobacterium sp. 9R]|uniref:DUF2141 domain-containing protein n=1 Tax=Flavobacterium sp. 9R TaxID=2653143 RepID=UPI0012F31593|nr:DUF2141 domain-containing protein [Flavobacterium sp. 9R]VXC08358.1 conserved exported hypothetical protein [Flavobacterium sp. 9R]
MYRFIILFLFVCSMAFSQNTSLTATVTGIKNNTGKLTVEVYNSKGKFLKSVFKTTSSTIKSNSAIVVFSDLPKSEYTVMVYHDENNNGKLDKNFIGMPKEAVACSNNAKGFMGPPKYEDAKFSLVADSKITIKMNDKL